jgi:hypothetical protein
MIQIQQKNARTASITTAALLALTLVFSAEMLVLSRFFGYVVLSLAAACSGLCLAFAWTSWNRHAEIRIPSIARTSQRPD